MKKGSDALLRVRAFMYQQGWRPESESADQNDCCIPVFIAVWQLIELMGLAELTTN
jgi:hypothetical protein